MAQKEIKIQELFDYKIGKLNSLNLDRKLLSSQQSNQDKQIQKRDQFNNDFEYFMSVLGYAVGYGSIWRFPYIMYKNGGGTFLIPYCIFVMIIACPIFMFESGLGQIFQKSLPLIFEERIHKKWKGVGIWAIIVGFTCTSFYNYIQSISFYYVYYSFQTPLPWTVGDGNLFERAQQFLFKKMLKVSGSINEFGEWNGGIYGCYLVSILFVLMAIYKGPTQSGKVAIVTASAPYILLTIMLINGFSLQGSGLGVSEFFRPDLSKLWSGQIWVDALVQVLFQYSSGMGVIVLLSSYRNKSESITRAAKGLIFGTFLCGILGGMIVFQYLGHMSFLTNTPIHSLPLNGPMLSFVAYPTALAMIPFPNFFSLLFFLIMITLGIDTLMAMTESTIGYIQDEFPNQFILIHFFPKTISYFPSFITQNSKISNKVLVCLATSFSGLIYCSGCGIYMLEYVDAFNSTIGLTGQLIAEIYLIVISNHNFYNNFKMLILENTHQEIPQFIDFSLQKLILPILSIVLFLGAIDLFLYTLQINILVFAFLWFTQLFPIYISYKFYHENQDVLKIDMQTNRLNLSGSQNDEYYDVQYFQPQTNLKKY